MISHLFPVHLLVSSSFVKQLMCHKIRLTALTTHYDTYLMAVLEIHVFDLEMSESNQHTSHVVSCFKFKKEELKIMCHVSPRHTNMDAISVMSIYRFSLVFKSVWCNRLSTCLMFRDFSTYSFHIKPQSTSWQHMMLFPYAVRLGLRGCDIPVLWLFIFRIYVG